MSIKRFKVTTRAEDISAADIEEIKQEYITSDMSEDELFNFALELNIVGATLRDYAKQHKWNEAKAHYKSQQENLAEAERIYERLNKTISDEQINRYIPEYQKEARNKLIVLAYIDEVIFNRVQNTKDTVALAKYEARKIRAVRKKTTHTAQQATTRSKETTAINRLAEFQKKMRS